MERCVGMKEDMLFMALGGAQSIGASCYYFKLGKYDILMDCGTGLRRLIPDISSLVSSGLISSMRDIDYIIVSHAHMDHMGMLLEVANLACNAKVYLTGLTNELIKLQLRNKISFLDSKYDILGTESTEIDELYRGMEARVKLVNYFSKEVVADDLSFEFYPAGHIPGAMMTLVNYKRRRILYTGDFSSSKTALAGGYMLPNGLKVDIMLMNGTYSKNCTSSVRNMTEEVRKINSLISLNRRVVCTVPQLSKGVEILKALNDNYTDRRYRGKDGKIRKAPEYKLLVTDSIRSVAERLEALSIPIFNSNNHSWSSIGSPNVYQSDRMIALMIKGADASIDMDSMMGGHVNVDIDFSIHDKFDDVISFIKDINPRKLLVVHSPNGRGGGETIEQVLMRDAECSSQLLFPEKCEIIDLR